MGCLLAEFKLTAMLFGGERRGKVGGGGLVWLPLLFGGLSPLHSPPLHPHFHFPLEKQEEKKNTFQGRACAVRWSADGFVRKYAAL